MARSSFGGNCFSPYRMMLSERRLMGMLAMWCSISKDNSQKEVNFVAALNEHIIYC